MLSSLRSDPGQGRHWVTTRKEPWLVAPCRTLSGRSRWLWLVGCSLAVLAWCRYLNGSMGAAWQFPDVRFYLDMANGLQQRVPQPFTSRPLAPMLAAGLAHVMHSSVENGFWLMVMVCVSWMLGVVYWLVLRSSAPRWILLAVACLPFWPQMVAFAGLPDPLYSALLAALLLALEYDHVFVAASLMLPLMLARESTSLTLVCFLLAGWRRLRWSAGAFAVACAGAGVVLVRHFSASGLANPEHLSGRVYLLGKVVANTSRSLGIVPWSNVYPVLCPRPVWRVAMHLGGIQSVGVCSVSMLGPMQVSWAFLTTFGVLPLLAVVVLYRGRTTLAQSGFAVRFCVLYGGISLLLAPTLGTWYARLFAYAWPLLLVALPRLYGDVAGGALLRDPAWFAAALLALDLLICALGSRIDSPWLAWLVVALQASGLALILVHLRGRRAMAAALGSKPPAW